jgi:hypothetical protein
MEAKIDSNQAKLEAYHKEMMAKLEAQTAVIQAKTKGKDDVQVDYPSGKADGSPRNPEKAAQGPQSGRGAPPEEAGKGPGNLWIEEICRRPQRNRPLCREHGHKRYDLDCVAPGSPEGRTSGMRPTKGPGCNNGISDRGQKQPLSGNRDIKDLCGKVMLHFGNKKDNQQDLLEDHRTGDIEASCKDFQRVAKNHKSDLVEGSAPSEKEEEPVRSFGVRGAGNVGAPATMNSLTYQ